ncbi:hypothetical protein [Haloferax sp. KTX1]|uniref:hypothetical protein n=1 Tax=Haloferax sp. KTX1 TaxID=2600597 RepID=UPI0011DCB1E3|nr:hypothetical protein [Haloferax sp. KTX1]
MSYHLSTGLALACDELDHVMGVIRSVRTSEAEFRAEVASNFGVGPDDFDVESELVDGHLVHRARWSP